MRENMFKERSSKLLFFAIILALVSFIISGFVGDGTAFSLHSRGEFQGMIQLFTIFLTVIAVIFSLIFNFIEKKQENVPPK